MNGVTNDLAEATVVYTTTTNGKSITEEKISKAHQEEVKSHN